MDPFFICPHTHHRRYCPSVITTSEDDLYTKPKTQLTLLLKPKRPRDARKLPVRKISQGQSDPSWLYPILLPSIFPTLFSLYKAHHSEEDLKVHVAMESLRTRSDKEICEILDIKRYGAILVSILMAKLCLLSAIISAN